MQPADAALVNAPCDAIAECADVRRLENLRLVRMTGAVDTSGGPGGGGSGAGMRLDISGTLGGIPWPRAGAFVAAIAKPSNSSAVSQHVDEARMVQLQLAPA